MGKVLVGVVGTAAFVSALGCGGTYYAVVSSAAASRLDEARAVGAERLAPYEYHYARRHLDQARYEAGHASYGDAAEYAETAEEYATKAIELSRSQKAPK